MRRSVVLAAAAAVAMLAASDLAVSTAATASPFLPGDQVVYSVTVELQQHHVRGKAKRDDIVSESSAQGTATFAIYAVGQDGTAFANVALDFKGTNEGQPVELQTTTPGKITAAGQLLTKAHLGLGVSDAFGAANTTSGEIARHETLAVGKSWTNAAKTSFLTLDVKRTVVGRTRYQGFAAYTLQSVGNGSLLRTADGQPASGTITVGGTTYYDDRNRMLIGEAFRTLLIVQPAIPSMHDDYSSAFDVVLDSWTHASPAPLASAAPSPLDTSSPLAPVPDESPTPMLGL